MQALLRQLVDHFAIMSGDNRESASPSTRRSDAPRRSNSEKYPQMQPPACAAGGIDPAAGQVWVRGKCLRVGVEFSLLTVDFREAGR
jgi:hypothetical protein